jgi:hypothetical protein
LKVSTGNITSPNSNSLRYAWIVILCLLFSFPALSQNTKGDRPKSSREGRFKTQKKDRKGPGFTSRRIRTQGRSAANSGGAQYTPRRNPRGGERSGRPLRPIWSVKKPSDKQKAWKGDISGRRIRHKNESSTTPYVHRQPPRTTRRVIPDREGRQNVTPGRPPRIPSATGKVRNVFPQKGKFVSNPSRTPRDTQRPVSNRTQLARLKTLETKKPPPGRKVRVVPRTVSRPFIRHKSINVYANFRRPKQKGERATTKDLAGRKIRTKNYQTSPIGLIKARPRTDRNRVGDRPFSGPSGSYKSISGRNGRAWVGDISNRKIRSRSGKQTPGGGIFSRNRSATRTGQVGKGIGVRAPGIGAKGVGNYRGDRRNIKGFRNQGEVYSGGIKSRNMRGFRNQGESYSGSIRTRNMRGFRNQGEMYSGALKARKRVQGGGSVSGKLWNNDRSALPVKTGKVNTSGIPGKLKLFQARPGFRDQGEEYTGAIKRKRPLKGGGSVSGKLWNNDETPLVGKQRSQRGLNFAGNMKARRPEKGGGSVSGKLWNNDGTPIPGKTFPSEARKVSGFPGKMKRFEAQPGFRDQGEEFTGYIKLSRLKRNYVQNKLAHDESIKKKKPQKETFGVEGLQVRVQRRPYVRNKNASDEALDKLRPTRTDQAVAGLQVKVKSYSYRRNPSSADEALKVREPGKAFARATDYQGNIKMQKYKLFERNRGMHPDSRFVKTNRNNVDDERDALTNFKLWWARLFKKEATQPEHLKEKLKKPRYDKGEQGMWYD